MTVHHAVPAIPSLEGKKMTTTKPTPLRAVGRGLLAGAAGTFAVDALLFARYRRSGGACPFTIWEFSVGLDDWEDAAAPAQLGRRLVEGVTQRGLPARRATLVSNLTHWSYGALAGLGVWATGYAVRTRSTRS
jgi:hypothetical protein